MNILRTMYDSMAQLVGDDFYPESWWLERNECFNKISPGLVDTLDLAWKVLKELKRLKKSAQKEKWFREW